MTNWTDDAFMRRSVTITFLWLVAMLMGGLLLVFFGDVLMNALT